MTTRKRRMMLIVMAVLAITISVVFGGWRAVAGIGPSGFAQYARQGITSENCRVYGGCVNSPWRVSCVDHPNYVTLTDVVTCRVVRK